jgi:hypothetical protein
VGGNVTGSVGSVVGAVGSVTGAVGSVTGNVGGNVTGSVGSLATQAKADVNAEVDSSIETYHLDHLLAADYDPASKPGVSTALLNELIESDSGVSRYTANALEQAPTGGGTPQTGDAYAYLTSNLGAAGAAATEAGGTGDHLTAINLPDQTMNITGDITGNLSGSVGSVTGAVGSVTGAVGSVTGNVTGSVGSLATQAKADVNTEVLDVLNVDTFAEPAQGTPGATITLAAKIGYLYKFLRNRKTQTATTKSIYNDDATTVDHKCTVADDGTTYSETEMTTGP